MLHKVQKLPTNIVVAILSQKGYSFAFERALTVALPQTVLSCGNIVNEAAVGE